MTLSDIAEFLVHEPKRKLPVPSKSRYGVSFIVCASSHHYKRHIQVRLPTHTTK